MQFTYVSNERHFGNVNSSHNKKDWPNKGNPTRSIDGNNLSRCVKKKKSKSKQGVLSIAKRALAESCRITTTGRNFDLAVRYVCFSQSSVS